MDRRCEIIVEMLKRYSEAKEPGIAGSIGEKLGGGDSGAEMPKTWNRSYRELDRCLSELRDERKSQFWHLSERYLRCETVTMTVRTRKGRPILDPHSELIAGAASTGEGQMRVRVRKWKPAVREEKVRRGVTRLSELFHGEPMLPNEFLDLNERKAA